MGWYDAVQYAGCTPDERVAPHPADAHSGPLAMRFVRAIDVDAEAPVVFRWLCQLTVAPYSYDLLDNLGRRSPRALTPGADDLAVGQRFLIGRIVDVVPGASITSVSTPGASAVFGRIALSYAVTPGVEARSRIVACMTVEARSWAGRLKRRLLGAGDLVMMSKQLRTLKACAEAAGTGSSTA